MSMEGAESSRISGYDAGKKIKGRKRHIVVDTLGLMVGLVVHSADIQDGAGALPDDWCALRPIRRSADGQGRNAPSGLARFRDRKRVPKERHDAIA